MRTLKKELLYPIIVGLVVGLVLLLGGIAIEQLRKPSPLPPAEVFYGSSNSTVTSDNLAKAFPKNFTQNPDSGGVSVSHLFISNASGRTLNDLSLVTTSRLYDESSWLDIDVRMEDAILSEAIDSKSIDSNGTLRINIKKFGDYGQIELIFKSKNSIYFSQLDTTSDNVNLRNISIPQYLYAAQEKGNGWLTLFSVISALISAVGTFLAIRENGQSKNV